MSLEALINRLKRPDEVFTLQILDKDTSRNEIGDFSENWIDLQELNGIIQSPAMLQNVPHGYEITTNHIGIFVPDFDIEPKHLGRYRIKQETEEAIYYFKISEFDSNMPLKNKIHHYELKLELNPKW